MHNIYKHEEDIYSIYNRAARSNYDNKHDKYDKEVRAKTISNEYIY